jgi:hypothetical protein
MLFIMGSSGPVGAAVTVVEDISGAGEREQLAMAARAITVATARAVEHVKVCPVVPLP